MDPSLPKSVPVLMTLACLLPACAPLPLDGADPGAGGSARADYYEVRGFYVFSLEHLRPGSTRQDVMGRMGTPSVELRARFLEPNRVRLASLPEFDEQWGYFEGLANNWVFFREGKMVAAFREESDW